MKKVVMMTFMFMMMWNVKSYAGKGLCCCCDCDEEYASLNRAHLIEDFGTKWIVGFEDFKKYYTADGHCEMHRSRIGTIPIKEELRAGRGQKTLVYVYHNALNPLEKGPNSYFYFRGSAIRKGSIIDYERAEIYHPDGRSPFVHK